MRLMSKMKTETIRIRIDSDLLNKVRTLAEQQTRPIAKQIEHLLKIALKTKGE
jgi:hypothetical protein